MTDPKRLSELGSEAPDALRGLLRASRDDLPGAERLEGLAARLGPLIGGAAAGITAGPAAADAPPSPQTPPADPSAAAGAATGSGVAAKAIGVGAAIVVLVGGAWLSTRPDPVTPTPPSVAAPAVEQSPVSRTEHAAKSGDPVPSTAPLASVAEPAERPAKPPVSRATRSPPAGPSESALLAQAQAALNGNPSRALALTREHKRRFPNGALAQEREVIAIEALKRIGDGESARKRAKDFENSYPGSAHTRKVQNATKP